MKDAPTPAERARKIIAESDLPEDKALRARLLTMIEHQIADAEINERRKYVKRR